MSMVKTDWHVIELITAVKSFITWGPGETEVGQMGWMFAKFKKDVDSQLSLFSSSAVQSELDVIKLFRFSDICAKRHLRERHLREGASICPDKPSNPSLTTNLCGASSAFHDPPMASFWLTELRGKGTELGEGERHWARRGGKAIS